MQTVKTLVLLPAPVRPKASTGIAYFKWVGDFEAWKGRVRAAYPVSHKPDFVMDVVDALDSYFSAEEAKVQATPLVGPSLRDLEFDSDDTDRDAERCYAMLWRWSGDLTEPAKRANIPLKKVQRAQDHVLKVLRAMSIIAE